MIRYAVGVLALCAMSGKALAQFGECGLPPQLTYYRTEFYQAQAKLVSDAASRGLDTNATVPIQGVPVMFGLSHETQNNYIAYESLTVAQATTIIQKEITDQRQAIIAECGYRICEAGRKPGAEGIIRAQIVAEICYAAQSNLAFSTSPVQSTLVYPSSHIVVFDGSTARRSSGLRLLTDGSLDVKPGAPTGGDQKYVKYVGTNSAADELRTSIGLDPKQTIKLDRNNKLREVVFYLTRPPAIERREIAFRAADNPGNFSRITFLLVPHADDLLPLPQITCGTTNPGLNARATRTAQVPQVKDDNSEHRSLVEKREVVALNYEIGAGAEQTGACPSKPPAQGVKGDGRRFELHFKHSSWYQSGFSPTSGDGGFAAWRPQWKGVLRLPGDPSRHIYILTSVVAVPSRHSCVFQIGSQQHDAAGQAKWSLQPGEHYATVTCDKQDYASSNWGEVVTADLTIELDVVRNLKAEAPVAAALRAVRPAN